MHWEGGETIMHGSERDIRRDGKCKTEVTTTTNREKMKCEWSAIEHT